MLYIIWCIASVVVVIRPEVGVCRMKMLMNMDVYWKIKTKHWQTTRENFEIFNLKTNCRYAGVDLRKKMYWSFGPVKFLNNWPLQNSTGPRNIGPQSGPIWKGGFPTPPPKETKDRAIWTPLKPWVNSRRMSSSCSTNGIRK